MTERDPNGDLDARFEAIISHWDDEVPGGAEDDVADGPSATDESAETTDPDDGSGDSARGDDDPRHGSPAWVNPPWPVWRGPTNHLDPLGPPATEAPGESRADQDDADDEHFEPGPTAPLPPQEDLHFWGIVVGLTVGPLLLLWLVLLRPDVSRWWTWLAVGLSVGGFILLILRQPAHRDGDDPDDGARV